MIVQNKEKIVVLIISLSLIFLLAGCFGSSLDKTKIIQIAENIEKSIDKKDVNLFMENVSYDYSDSNDGTYDNHINNLPEELFAKVEEAEDLVDIFLLLKIETKVTIPESDLVITDIYASGKMEIKISLKACVAWVLCTTLYNEDIEYNADFIKEDDDWKVISLEEI